MMDSVDEMLPRLQTSHHIGFIGWLRHPQRGLPYLVCSVLIILVLLPFLIHYYLSSVVLDEQAQITSVHGHRSDRASRFGSTKASELKMQIEELRNIRLSVSNELLELEKKRQALLSDISGYTIAIDGLKQSYQTTSEELERLKISFANLQVEQKELMKNNLPNIEAPRRILAAAESFVGDSWPTPFSQQFNSCDVHTCFDYSRCSVTSQFPVYVYPFENSLLSASVDTFIKESLRHAFNSSPYIVDDPHDACLFVVVIGDGVIQTLGNASAVEYLLYQLPFWRGTGFNHLLISFTQQSSLFTKQLSDVETGAAMVAQSHFRKKQFRQQFDVVLPAAVTMRMSDDDVWEQLPMLVPARRKYLLTFVGEFVAASEQLIKSADKFNDNITNHFSSSAATSPDGFIVDALKTLQVKYAADGFYFEFICTSQKAAPAVSEWTFCGTEAERAELLQQSTFSVIIAPADTTLMSTSMVQAWLFELLRSGAIPVIIGDFIRLPFEEIIRWPQAVVKLPKARITEIHFILRSFTDADILEMRRQGRLIFETFLSTTKSVINSLLAVIRRRLLIPAFPIQDEPSPSVFNETFVPLYETVMESVLEADEMLGPVEPPLASPRYYRNFTFENDGFALPGDPFHSYPYTPFEPLMPADAKFVGSSYGFRPIGQGAGGTGKEFSEALGGNVAREQFTVVILTYEREAVLINAVSRLKGLPHVNKVVVVWNNPRPPAEDLRWPDIGVKIHVIKTAKNSLNNRFLPYDAIETEAVLSVDDDAHLRHDEIMFGFRIWREARDRIVGFPGRFNSWDVKHQNWLYNSNYSCELSMVLTGAAFIHKYYFYVYSYIMPQAIRDKVDEYLNCEDLAMNFLVSHITRKPPIKVTSRWTFRCPGCPKALSVEESHFNERHKCVNFFVRVYGYMPLLNTQFRADSVLFKTRIPHDKQKCFKFI